MKEVRRNIKEIKARCLDWDGSECQFKLLIYIYG